MRRLAAGESDVTVPSRDLRNEIGEAVRSVSSAATEMQSTAQSMFWIAEATSGQAVASVKCPATHSAKATEQIAAQIQAVQDRRAVPSQPSSARPKPPVTPAPPMF